MPKPMKILIDQNIPGAVETFAHHGQVLTADGRALRNTQLREVQALIIRSVTCVNSELLHASKVGFVGTTTIGTDHMDVAWLEQRGIRWASAPGCNADAAAQYTVAMMILAGQRIGFSLSSRTVGIVGHGNVGSRVHQILKTYGVRQIKVCDPPLADSGRPGLCALKDLMDCDVITLHVPLTRSGPYPTLGLAGEALFSRLQAGSLLVNTSRGKVTDTQALQGWLASGQGHAALDVWPGEPEIDARLLEAATVATPHVAGYSLDGKLRGTQMVYRQFCEWLKTSPVSPDLLSDLRADARLKNRGLTTDDAILAACPVARDDAQMRKLAAVIPEKRAVLFDELRRDYPIRRDFCGWQVPADAPPEVFRLLRRIGFR